MNFWDSLQAKVGAWLDGTTVETLQSESDRQDALMDAQNRNDAEKYGPVWQEQIVYNQTREDSGYQMHAGASIEAGFEEGWAIGEENIRDTVGGAVKGTLGTVWKLLPPWIWAALIIAAVLYFFGPAIRAKANQAVAK